MAGISPICCGMHSPTAADYLVLFPPRHSPKASDAGHYPTSAVGPSPTASDAGEQTPSPLPPITDTSPPLPTARPAPVYAMLRWLDVQA